MEPITHCTIVDLEHCAKHSKEHRDERGVNLVPQEPSAVREQDSYINNPVKSRVVETKVQAPAACCGCRRDVELDLIRKIC